MVNIYILFEYVFLNNEKADRKLTGKPKIMKLVGEKTNNEAAWPT